MASVDKFTGRSAAYAAGRPGYPEELVERLARWAGLGPESIIADVGAGTGIFSSQLVSTGAQVIAIEPNADMRDEASAILAEMGYVEVRAGTAEALPADDASIDVVTAAQAFHWFDADAFRAECLRVLRPPARVALIWNMRVSDAEVNRACERLFRRLCPAFAGFTGGITADDERVRSFFSHGFERWRFDHPLAYDRGRFLERCLSGSYAPRRGDATYPEFCEGVEEIFDRFAREDEIVVPNEAWCFAGELLGTSH